MFIPPINEKKHDLKELNNKISNNIPPGNVEEYLLMVKMEADKVLPDIHVYSDINPRNYDTNQTTNMPFYETIQCDLSIIQSVYSENIIKNFNSLRKKLICMNKIKSINRQSVPRMNDEQGWYYFIFNETFPNKDIIENIEQNNIDEEIDEMDEGRMNRSSNLTSNGKVTNPTTSLILQFDQVLTRKLLEYFIKWIIIRKLQISKLHGLWLYALMAHLDIPLYADTQSHIRSLLRTTVSIYNKMEKKTNDDILASNILHLLICITGIFFGQLEL